MSKSLQSKVERLISKVLEDPAFDFGISDDSKVSCFVISTTFEDMFQKDRQDIVWNCLKAGMSEKDCHNVITLLTLAPDEWNG